MPLIKAAQSPQGLQPFSMQDVENAAKGILLRARRQVEALLTEAQHEADLLREAARIEGEREGFDKGHAEGMRQGTDAGRAKAEADHGENLAAAAQAMVAVTSAFDDSRDQFEIDGLQEVIRLAVAIARRVTKRQGLLDPAVLTENLSEAMRLAVHAADIRIAIRPEQRATLEAALPNLRNHWQSLRHVEIMHDETLSSGGCRVFTPHGRIDADLDQQIDRVVADLLPIPMTGGV